MQEEIVGFLKRRHTYLSGEEISSRLGISRQGLWKHIQELKNSGYDIIAVPHLGYKLVSSPDRLFPSEISFGLHTKFIGRKIYYFDSISSTMDKALELGMKGAPEGTIILSESQTKGRGRQGREWSSPKHKGIYMSLILRPRISPSQASVLVLLAGVSVCEAVQEVTGLETQIKWPNDVLMRHKKVGGILTELNAEMDEVRFMVIGIGINVNNEKNSLVGEATSLKEQKKEIICRIDLLRVLLKNLEANYTRLLKHGASSIIDKWQQYSVTIGKRVKIFSHKEFIEGEAVGIDSDGGLLLRKDSGVVQKVTSGDAVYCR